MENSSNSFFGEYRERIEGYIQNRLRLMQLQLTQKTANLSATLTWAILFAGMLFFLILSVSLMAGFYLGERWGSYWLGFACVAGIFLLKIIFLIIFRKSIQRMVTNRVIESMLTPKTEDHAPEN
ncbi:MAG: hypothetical protein EBX50_02080 [Chitinophagia bacterium]|nr:hypothetical protein [Chitinophagia bacterium]